MPVDLSSFSGVNLEWIISYCIVFNIKGLSNGRVWRPDHASIVLAE